METNKLRFFALTLLLGLFSWQANAITKTVGTTGADYATLKAAFDDINLGTLAGAIVIQVIDNTTETASASLSSGTVAPASWTSVTIYPTVTGKTISGTLGSPIITLNGAANVTIDGRLNQTGTKDLTISNLNAANSGATIKIMNSATSNTVKYCTLKGSSSATTGIVLLAGSAAGTGNDYNTIDNNDITNALDAWRPLNAIYDVASTATILNDHNTFSNNNIYNFLNKGTASTGILVGALTSDETISGNSFYETASFVPTASVAYTAISINNNTTGVNYSVSGNFIGGQAALCAGSAWTKTNAFDNIFYCILINTFTGGTGTSVQGNTIKNISWANSATSSLHGIRIDPTNVGIVNIGTVTGNTIGASDATISVTLNGTFGTTPASRIAGIWIDGTGFVDCEKNTVSYITTNNTDITRGVHTYGIVKANQSAAATTASYNIVNHLTASSTSTSDGQIVSGIYILNGTGNVSVDHNTVYNLTNSCTAASAVLARTIGVRGHLNTAANNSALSVSYNTVHDVTSANDNNLTGGSVATVGIFTSNGSSSTTPTTVNGNTVYAISNSSATAAVSVDGIVCGRNSKFDDVCSGNLVYGISATSPAALITGIDIATNFGASTATYSNNIISLSTNNAQTLYGIFERSLGVGGSGTHLYYNTVYIGGTPISGTNNSYALYVGAANTYQMVNYKNNIFVNARSNNSASGKHYAMSLTSTSLLTTDYNDYYVSGTGGMLGSVAAADQSTIVLLRTATGGDVNTLNVNPVFDNAGGTLAVDYKTNSTVALPAVLGTGILTDFGGITRAVLADAPKTPVMGAWETSKTTKLNNVEMSNVTIIRTATGIVVPLTSESTIELYTVNGLLIEKTKASGIFTHALNNGMYIICINGKASKFVK